MLAPFAGPGPASSIAGLEGQSALPASTQENANTPPAPVGAVVLPMMLAGLRAAPARANAWTEFAAQAAGLGPAASPGLLLVSAETTATSAHHVPIRAPASTPPAPEGPVAAPTTPPAHPALGAPAMAPPSAAPAAGTAPPASRAWPT